MKIINIFENTIYKEIHTFRDTLNQKSALPNNWQGWTFYD